MKCVDVLYKIYISHLERFSVDYENVNICYHRYFHPMDFYVHVSAVGLNRKQKKLKWF